MIFAPGLTEVGGAARRSRIISSEFAGRGWDVRVIARAGTHRRFGRLDGTNLRGIEIPGFGRRRIGAILFLCVALPLGLVWGARSKGFLAIQLTSQTTTAAVCSLFLRRPFVSMATTGGSVSEMAYVASARTASLRKAFLRRAAALIAQTEDAAAELRALVPDARISVIPNPVLPVDPASLDGRPNAVFAGRLSEEKDLPTLLIAWKEVRARRPDAVLTLVGSGGGFRSTEEGVKLMLGDDPGLARSVRLTGWVPDAEPFLREADVFVLPSLSEGMSNALLEACALARVVVASDIGSNVFVLGADYPLLFRAGDPDSLVRSLEQAFSDAEIRDRAVRHVVAIAKQQSPERIVAELEELIARGAHSARNQYS